MITIPMTAESADDGSLARHKVAFVQQLHLKDFAAVGVQRCARAPSQTLIYGHAALAKLLVLWQLLD
jgi:hypothetical protein